MRPLPPTAIRAPSDGTRFGTSRVAFETAEFCRPSRRPPPPPPPPSRNGAVATTTKLGCPSATLGDTVGVPTIRRYGPRTARSGNCCRPVIGLVAAGALRSPRVRDTHVRTTADATDAGRVPSFRSRPCSAQFPTRSRSTQSSRPHVSLRLDPATSCSSDSAPSPRAFLLSARSRNRNDRTVPIGLCAVRSSLVVIRTRDRADRNRTDDATGVSIIYVSTRLSLIFIPIVIFSYYRVPGRCTHPSTCYRGFFCY